MVDMS
jgi:hypothetical protein